MEGRIISGVGGIYRVAVDGLIVECSLRGSLRLGEMTPTVGDRVEVDADQKVIAQVYDRVNILCRPSIANIDLLVICVSAAPPVTDYHMIDKICAVAFLHGITPVICVNKNDLVSGMEYADEYARSGIRSLCVSAANGTGIDELKHIISGKVSAFTGNSGVGKSSILNAISPDLGLRTSGISDRLGRGKHTTRHVELFEPMSGTFVADTPGFSAFDIVEFLLPDELRYAFPEFAPYSADCRFSDCTHTGEPGCAVAEAANNGKISTKRFESYREMYQSVRNHKAWEKRK